MQVPLILNKFLWEMVNNMKKIQTMSIPQFINGHFVDESFARKAINHIKRNKNFYITVGCYAVFFICCGLDASAATAGEFDHKAVKIYNKLISVGKWIVIVKAGIDVINTATQGDFGSVKTKLIGYLVVFLTLLGLPWAFDQIDGLFQDTTVSGG